MRTDLHRTEVDGVPTLWDEQPGPLTASLIFRVGVIDESLYNRGITHVVEHLALRQVQESSYFFNGFVDVMRTAYVIRGEEGEVVDYLSSLCRALADLPADRLHRERDILRTEAASRLGSPIESFLNLRFGARGPGLLNFDEFGLDRVQRPEIQEWAKERFCRENAVLWMTGPPPKDLELPLPPGERIRVNLPEPIDLTLPGWSEGSHPGVGASFSTERAVSVALLAGYFDQRARTAFRLEGGMSYGPLCSYLPLSADRAEISVWADCLPENGKRAIEALEVVLRDVSEGQFDSEVLESVRSLTLRSWADPQAAVQRLDRAALDVLLGLELDDWIDDYKQLTEEDLFTAFKAIEHSGIVLVPAGNKVTAWPPIPLAAHEPPPGGKRLKPRRSREAGVIDEVILFDGGVSFRQGDTYMTVRYGECELLLRWKDGCRVVIGTDGTILLFHPDNWKNGDTAAEQLDVNLSHVTIHPSNPSPLERQNPPPPDAEPAEESDDSFGWPMYVAWVFALNGLRTAFFPTDVESVWGRVVAFLIGAAAAIFLLQGLFRSHWDRLLSHRKR